MSRISTRLLSQRARAFLLVAAAFGVASCSSSSGGNPTTPSVPTGAVQPAATPAVVPAATPATVQVSVNPDPVPFSGAAILDTGECTDFTNTWFYDTVLHETAGVSVTFTTRIDLFDGKVANNLTGLNIVLGPHDTVVLHTRWCSGASTAHTAQSIFGGVDGNGNLVSAQGQIAHLMTGVGK